MQAHIDPACQFALILGHCLWQVELTLLQDTDAEYPKRNVTSVYLHDLCIQYEMTSPVLYISLVVFKMPFCFTKAYNSSDVNVVALSDTIYSGNLYAENAVFSA